LSLADLKDRDREICATDLVVSGLSIFLLDDGDEELFGTTGIVSTFFTTKVFSDFVDDLTRVTLTLLITLFTYKK
jgi:hypothetical protein